jgi:hypothetical protein
MAQSLDDDGLRALRLRAQLLTEPAKRVSAVVSAIGAIQAQSTAAARMAIRARSSGLTAASVDHAVSETRSVVRTWAMRGTLQMMPSADIRWLIGLLGPRFTKVGQRRRNQLGLTDALCAKAMTAFATILKAGPLTRTQIVEQLADHGVRIDRKTQAPPHLLMYAANQGLICRGPDVEKDEPTYVLLADWLAGKSEHSPADPLAELARRYLTGHPAATPADFVSWSGLPAGDGRQAFELLGDELVPVGPGFALATTSLEPPKHCPPRLLGQFDAYLLGYKSRNLILEPKDEKRIRAGGGMINPAVLADGRLVGTWRLDRTAKAIKITVTPFGELPRGAKAGLAAEAEDIGRFLGSPSTLTVG